MNRRIATEAMPPAQSVPSAKLSGLIWPIICSADDALGRLIKEADGRMALAAVRKKISMMPRTKPQSLTRLAINAFFAAGPSSLSM
jgi:hypothetical protein